MTHPIPLSAPDITESEIDAVNEVLRTNTLSLGPKLEEFEHRLAAWHQMPHAIAVSSGTAALHLALLALNITAGDQVLVPSFTFIAVANAVRYVGAIPIFVDIDPITLNIDPDRAAEAITSRTRAIIIVHTFGVPAEMDALLALARTHDLRIIEDACEAIGATYRNQLAGTFGDLSVFAFYPNKQMTTGEGGALLCRDPGVAARLRALRNQGRYTASPASPTFSDNWLHHAEVGYNYRLPEIACALGIAQLNRIDTMLEARRQVAERYDRLLSEISGVIPPPLNLHHRSISWFVYVVRIVTDPSQPLDQTRNRRDQILNHLRSKSIGCAPYFAPIHLQPAYANLASSMPSSLPVTDAISGTTIALPFYNRLTPTDAETVVATLAQALSPHSP